MHRLRAAIAAMLLLGSLLAVGAIAPATVSATCAQAQITLANGTSGNGERRTFCFAGDVSNLSNVTPGPCGAFSLSWNDCASSIRLQEGTTNTAACLWNSAGFVGNGLKIISDVGWYNLGGDFNNQTSSIEWGNNCDTD